MQIGDQVQLGGFGPMSTMEEYEGVQGKVIGLEKRPGLGVAVQVQISPNKSVRVGRAFVTLISAHGRTK